MARMAGWSAGPASRTATESQRAGCSSRIVSDMGFSFEVGRGVAHAVRWARLAFGIQAVARRPDGRCSRGRKKSRLLGEAEAPSLSHRVVAGVHVELLKYGGDVVVDRAGRQDESLGDVRVGQAVREQAQDLHLSGGET